jgi:hypothetical protein
MSVRDSINEEWRTIADLLDPTRSLRPCFHRPKTLQAGGLRASAADSAHDEMALWALEKAPKAASFDDFFDDFLRVFLQAFPPVRDLARIRTRNALVRAQTSAMPCLLWANMLAPRIMI